MNYSFNEKKRLRKSFEINKSLIEVPYLLKIQKDSFAECLQKGVNDASKKNIGIQKAFQDIFPINSLTGVADLEFIDYSIGEPEFSPAECRQRGATYSSPLHVTLRLVFYEKADDIKNKATEDKKIKNIIEEKVYFGEIPLMSDHGSFILNGTERAVVTQLHRSPGAIFDDDKKRFNVSGKTLFNSRIIPYRGSWLDFEFDNHDCVFARIDRKRKFPVTLLFHALEMDNSEILHSFFEIDTLKIKADKVSLPLKISRYKGFEMPFDVLDSKGKIILLKGKKVTVKDVKKIEQEGIKSLDLLAEDYLLGKVLSDDLMDDKATVARANDVITQDLITEILDRKISKVSILYSNTIDAGSYISDTLRLDTSTSLIEAQIEIYRIIRPGEPATAATAADLFHNLFFNENRYDLSDVGRMKLNKRLGRDTELGSHILEKADILDVVKELVAIRNGLSVTDEIDTLANRRIRGIGEMVENTFRLGLVRVDRAVSDKLNIAELEGYLPKDLINSKPVSAALHDFLSKGQLSQFMDQVNPLAEITHKRRISALGPGGLTRERAGFEVRDVHGSHYGRICPIETPEGPNIGLINSLAIYANANKYGFLETPYRKVKNTVVTDEIEYLSAIDEESAVIAQASSYIVAGKLADDMVSARRNNDVVLVPAEEVNYIDVSAQQIVSVAASLIPFLEHDDANRALMGSNMQRQAVPLLKSIKPVVGTGVEKIVAKDSGATIIAKNSGKVVSVDSTRIVIQIADKSKPKEVGVDIYNLVKYKRSNQNTCINNIPIVKIDDLVVAGDVIADGPSTDLGELALGKNIRVAFMPWNGYNFEDSILLSEQLVKDDVFTSIHIEEHICVVRDTKQGPEEITSDIPNVQEAVLSKLDANGIVYAGAKVKAGDILVGKVTPKGETHQTPEEKLLRAIFGDKAADVKDTSLRVGSAGAGTVIDVQIYDRKEYKKNARSQDIIEQNLLKFKNDLDAEFEAMRNDILTRHKDELETHQQEIDISISSLWDINLKFLSKVKFKNKEFAKKFAKIIKQLSDLSKDLDDRYESKRKKLNRGDDMAPGVLQTVKVFVAVKRKIKAGDKMAGRHGNKGVVSRICPVEDMPYDKNGKPVEICLNPLGVPSRMNVGQILETHLGSAAIGLGEKINTMLKTEQTRLKKEEFLEKIYNKTKGIPADFKKWNDKEFNELLENLSAGVPFATPVFDGVSEQEIKQLLKLADLPESGQVDLFDGRSGDKFDRPVTVGYMYMLKLNHLVDDKMHARSTGPYSLVTQQPLSGKAQFGGQRFGEMEVWALEAYGAAYTLQEMLTVKSDDLKGRTNMYKNIIEGNDAMNPNVPESFSVLKKEIRALGLDLELEE